MMNNLKNVWKTTWYLFFLGSMTVMLILQYQKMHDSLHSEITLHNAENILSEEEQAVRRMALEHLHHISNKRQEDIRKEDETIAKKLRSDEFFFLDLGIRHKIQNDWDYDYWLAENYSTYYQYYLTYPSSTATIIGFAINTTFDKIRLFLDSLRRTGYAGRTIVVIHEKADENTIKHLKSHGVDIKYMHETKCTHELPNDHRPCIDPYPFIISEWSYIPVIRDHLLDCYKRNECNESVLVMDISKTVFQRDPFGVGARYIQKLELFEENPHVGVKTSTVRERILSCTGLDIRNRPMISPDSFAGPVLMVIAFLDHVYAVIRAWLNDPKCHSHHHKADDLQAIFNFLRLNSSMPVNTTYYSHRTGIVNNVGYDGKRILQSHIHFQQFRGHSIDQALSIPFEGSNGSRWIGNDYLLIDDEGYFVNLDFQRSFIVQQYDAFGLPYFNWANKKFKDISVK